MLIKKFENEKEWLSAREGKITGTKLKDITPKQRGSGYRAGFYKLIAEKIAVPPTTELAIDRGKRIEEEAIESFSKETGLKVDTSLVLWQREDNTDIAISPDGFIGEKEAVEVKCLNSENHIQTYLEGEIPSDYICQVYHYFIVNDSLEKLYFVMYDPRVTIDLFYFTVERKQIESEIKEHRGYIDEALKKLEEIERELTF